MATITTEYAKRCLPEDTIKYLVESSGFRMIGNVSYNVSHPDDSTALITLTIPVEEAFCQHCAQWRTDESIMRRYGEGMGRCDEFHEPKAGTHNTCLAFQSRE